jgi:Flp pilus assembly pilin Flp
MPRHHNEDGASATEYGLLVVLIAVVALGGMLAFGDTVTAMFNDSCSTVANARGGTC